MKKDYIIFSQHLAANLMLKGFVLQCTKKSDKPNSNKNIFIFRESDDLLKFVDEYKQIHKK